MLVCTKTTRRLVLLMPLYTWINVVCSFWQFWLRISSVFGALAWATIAKSRQFLDALYALWFTRVFCRYCISFHRRCICFLVCFWNGHSCKLYICGVSELCNVLACQRQITPKGGVASIGHVTGFWILVPHRISEIVDVTDLKFCTWVETWGSSFRTRNYSQKRLGPARGGFVISVPRRSLERVKWT